MDYGRHDDGSIPTIGDNIGAISGQAMSEPLTQMVLRTFHTGGAYGTGLRVSTFDKVDRLLSMQKIIRNQAPLATVTGRIDSVTPAQVKGGGHIITVGGHEHWIPRVNPMKDTIRVGAHVEKGDPLAEGIINPNELLRLKGMQPAMEYVAKELTDVYHKEGGVNLRQRNAETIIRALGSLTRIVDPGDSSYAPNEFAPYQVVEKFNRTAGMKKPISEAMDMPLSMDHGPVKAGTKLTPAIKKMLLELGHHTVTVGPRPIQHEPQLIGIKQMPLMRNDWMAHLGYSHIREGIIAGAGQRRESDIHGYSPIPAFAYGAEFGQGERGAY
jgi:hypothetical protein